MNSIVVHYHEIGLKGGNRAFFERKLVENIKNALKSASPVKVSRLPGRILVELKDGGGDAVFGCLEKIFGVSSFSPVLPVKTGLEEIQKAASAIIKNKKCKTFKVETRRAWKQFPLNSMEISRDVGAYVLQNSKLKVDVKKPDFIINIELLKDGTFVYCEKLKGPGGLPVGVSGKALILISGGIDSPVAAYFAMKRGCDVDFIHFHSYPFTDKASIEKVQELLKILGKFQSRSQLYLAPIIEFQKEVMKKAEARNRIVLYRRLMYKVAEELAKKCGHKALVSGDSLGQVASQTLDNIGVIGRGIELPILRPLIGFDKEEIINLAKKIGTYEISIEPHGDCCSVFLPQNPATKARLEDILREEKKIGMKKWVKLILENVKS